jgi:hypothetical protein
MRVTQRKGDIAVAQAIATFTRLGFDVALPLTESAPYDILVDDGRRIWRVQVRFTSRREVDLRRIHSNSQGYVIKKVKTKTYDWLYILKTDGNEYLIKECLISRRSIQPKMEHLLSMAEGVGFEPTVGCPTPVFKTGSLNRSDTLP